MAARAFLQVVSVCFFSTSQLPVFALNFSLDVFPHFHNLRVVKSSFLPVTNNNSPWTLKRGQTPKRRKELLITSEEKVNDYVRAKLFATLPFNITLWRGRHRRLICLCISPMIGLSDLLNQAWYIPLKLRDIFLFLLWMKFKKKCCKIWLCCVSLTANAWNAWDICCYCFLIKHQWHSFNAGSSKI